MPDIDEIAFAISDSEVEVLKCLWLESPLTAQQIVDKLQRDGNSHPQTIKTLINRLLKKGALGFHEKNRKYLYYPAIAKNDFYQIKTDTFLNKFFDGGISPFLSFFSSHKKLSKKEIAELKRLIKNIENED